MRFKLSAKYAIYTFMLIVVFTIGFSWLFVNQHIESFTRQIKTEGKYYTDILETSSAENLLTFDVARIRENIFFIKQNPLIKYVYITDTSGMVITDGAYKNSLSYQKLDNNFISAIINSKSQLIQEDEGIFVISKPIILDEDKLGYVIVGLTKAELIRAINEYKNLAILFDSIFLLFAFFFTYFIVNRVTQPIKQLTDLTVEVSKGKFDKRIILNTNDELSTLANSFNKMSKSLEEARLSLVDAKNKAEASDKLKSEFLAQISHEIRSPINTMLNYSRLVEEEVSDNGSSNLNEYFDVIRSANQRIIRTIDLILNMSEIQQGSYTPSFSSFDICNDVIIPLVSEFKATAKKKNLDLIPPSIKDKCLITADKYTVTQIFQNLIDNALKYTAEGYVKIDIRKERKHIFISVIDSGKGMSKEFQEIMFEPFRQEEQGYTRKYDGAGLGLSLVFNYVKLNKAEINVSSVEGKGSTFTVKFNQYSSPHKKV